MKPTINEIEIAKKIVNDLIEHNFFDAVICEDCENLYEWRGEYRDYLKENGLSIYSGETKACIVSDKLSDWVIKVGFVDMDEDTGTRTTDFCAIEEKNYHYAVEEKLEEFFAASYKLFSLTPPERYCLEGDVTFFIQEWAEPDEDKTSSTCERYMRDNSDEYDEDNDECCEYDDFDRIESLFEGCGRIDDLFEFIHDWGINDLHSGNFGYTKEGKAKIIDYSGY